MTKGFPAKKNILTLLLLFFFMSQAQVNAANDSFQTGKALYDEKRYEEAYPFLSKAAEEESAEAMMHLGKMFFNGWGVKHSHETARKWHEKAAALGNKESREKLKNFTHNKKNH